MYYILQQDIFIQAIMVKIGDRIREAREFKKLHQKQLAQKLKVAQNTVSQWETGINLPPADMIIKLAHALDCDPNYLLGFGE